MSQKVYWSAYLALITWCFGSGKEVGDSSKLALLNFKDKGKIIHEGCVINGLWYTNTND